MYDVAYPDDGKHAEGIHFRIMEFSELCVTKV